MPINSRSKGARGERAAAKVLAKTLHIEAHRGQQFSGGTDSPDVRHTLDGVHIEVKRVEKLNIHNSMKQAQRDADGLVPLVMHRRNEGEWLVTVPLDALPTLATSVYLTLAANNQGDVCDDDE